MTNRAQQIWEAFCGELTQEPTDDMREALVTTIRDIVNRFQYYNFGEGEDMILDARAIFDVADELEAL